MFACLSEIADCLRQWSTMQGGGALWLVSNWITVLALIVFCHLDTAFIFSNGTNVSHTSRDWQTSTRWTRKDSSQLVFFSRMSSLHVCSQNFWSPVVSRLSAVTCLEETCEAQCADLPCKCVFLETTRRARGTEINTTDVKTNQAQIVPVWHLGRFRSQISHGWEPSWTQQFLVCILKQSGYLFFLDTEAHRQSGTRTCSSHTKLTT